MIDLNEKFWFAACFFIFCFFAYRPLKKFIIENLDSNIARIHKDFEIANEKLSLSILNLKEANLRLNQAIYESNRIVKNMDKELESNSKKIDDEFQYKIAKLHSNNEEMIQKLYSNHLIEIENRIFKDSLSKLNDRITNKEIIISQKDIENVLKSIS
jgi:F0F1-type ATP synthase membrane subunit b/b'